MNEGRIYFDKLAVADDIFTKEKMLSWEQDLMESYESILKMFLSEMDPESPVAFAMNPSLLDDAIVDAVLGLKKITQSTNNTVDEPNTFKIVAYVTYWFLRHKPIQIFLTSGAWVEDVTVANSKDYNEIELQEANNVLAWKIKHINEYVAVTFALSNVFNYDIKIFNDKDFNRIKTVQADRFVMCASTP